MILLRDLKVVVRDLFDFCLTTGFFYINKLDFLESDIEFVLLDIESEGECSIDEFSYACVKSRDNVLPNKGLRLLVPAYIFTNSSYYSWPTFFNSLLRFSMVSLFDLLTYVVSI